MAAAFFIAIDHVQLAMPPGGEQKARAFYEGLLGMAEVPKPPELAKRGGCWFESGGVQLHLGVESDFRAAKKARTRPCAAVTMRSCCGDCETRELRRPSRTTSQALDGVTCMIRSGIALS
jgi:hypothetical protein